VPRTFACACLPHLPLLRTAACACTAAPLPHRTSGRNARIRRRNVRLPRIHHAHPGAPWRITPLSPLATRAPARAHTVVLNNDNDMRRAVNRSVTLYVLRRARARRALHLWRALLPFRGVRRVTPSSPPRLPAPRATDGYLPTLPAFAYLWPTVLLHLPTTSFFYLTTLHHPPALPHHYAPFRALPHCILHAPAAHISPFSLALLYAPTAYRHYTYTLPPAYTRITTPALPLRTRAHAHTLYLHHVSRRGLWIQRSCARTWMTCSYLPYVVGVLLPTFSPA